MKVPRAIATENQECAVFIGWCQLVRVDGEPLFERVVKIPNERSCASVSTAILVRLGMRPGFPDYEVLVPRPPYHALFLEAKRTRGGRIAYEQETWRENLRRWGYWAEICTGGEEMIAATRAYLAPLARSGRFVDRVQMNTIEREPGR